METIVKVDGLHFSYGSKQVLNDINFEIGKAEIIGLLGENGSGKTTLLDCLYGFHEGNKAIHVLSVSPTIDNPIIKKRVSYIQDTPALLDYLTAKQYLQFLCDLENISYQNKKDEIVELIRRFDITEDYTNKLLKDYSFGMKKKIQVIGEFLLHKELIIIDEPTNGLDVRMIMLLKELIREGNKTHHTTFVISSHNTTFLEDICNRVLLFHDKKMIKNLKLNESMNLETEFIMATKDSE